MSRFGREKKTLELFFRAKKIPKKGVPIAALSTKEAQVFPRSPLFHSAPRSQAFPIPYPDRMQSKSTGTTATKHLELSGKVYQPPCTRGLAFFFRECVAVGGCEVRGASRERWPQRTEMGRIRNILEKKDLSPNQIKKRISRLSESCFLGMIAWS